MAGRARQDEPGAWHHVMNRGVARRTLFEGRADVRSFLACLAWAVRRGELELHVWCILTTHFHLLVRSLSGELSEVMRRVQNVYTRHFNRKRRRDGPLVRGRFRSRRVDSDEYQYALVSYIDANAVQAGLVASPAAYPFGSASYFAGHESPPWHARAWVEGEVCRVAGLDRYDPSLYERVFPQDRGPRAVHIVERRLCVTDRTYSGSDLLDSASPSVREWMERKALLGDGTRPGIAVAEPDEIECRIREAREATGEWVVQRSHVSRSAWPVARVGLLRDLAGLTWAEVAQRVAMSRSGANAVGRIHAELLKSDPAYLRRLSELASRVLEPVSYRAR